MSAYGSMARQKRESIFQLSTNRAAKSNFIITDLFTNIEEASLKSDSSTSQTSNIKSFLRSHHVLNPTVMLALILLGLSTAIFSFFFSAAIQSLQGLRVYLSNTGNFTVDLGIWLLFCVTFAELATWSTSFLNKDCEGSGIPEMKAVLSSVKLKRFMSVKTLLAKSFGLICASGAGLSIGREGPLVHISAILSHQISKIRIFSHMKTNINLKNQFQASAVAAGVASIFESPIGGVLYSIEVTSTYYIVSNMWRSAFCSIWCALGITWLHNLDIVEHVYSTSFPQVSLSAELLLFFLLGVLSGIVGFVFINYSSRLISLREENAYPVLYMRYRYTLLISVICGLVTFLTEYTRLADITVINHMFQDNLNQIWTGYNQGFSLFIFLTCKILLTGLCLSCQVPAGLIYPLMATGAVFGRLFNYLASFGFSVSSGGLYAAIGAASVVSATTHTISVAVIVFEMTGQIHYFLPMILSVITAYSVSNFLGISIYDAMLEIKGLPYLPSLKPGKLQSYTARDIMEYSFPMINIDSKLSDLSDAIQEAGTVFNKIPCVDSEGNLVYDIKIAKAKEYFRASAAEFAEGLGDEGKENIRKYLNVVLSNEFCSIVDDAYRTVVVQIDDNEDVQKFLAGTINFSNDLLHGEDSPFAINETTPLAKVHFLFIMLGFNQIYVIRKGVLIGMISRESFSKVRQY